MPTPDAVIVFADLADALRDLDEARGSPSRVRRAFSRFVDLTQRLTAAIRKDYSRLGRGEWRAKDFGGWNQVTEFFKWLRNQDQHETPIRISVHERRFYEVPALPGRQIPIEGTWSLEDQLQDNHEFGVMKMYPADPTTGKPSADPVEATRIEYQYLVQPHSESALRRLREIGTTDMHQLSAACFVVLQDYFRFFLSQVGVQASESDALAERPNGDPGSAT